MQVLSQSPTEPGFVQDPYPFYERARANGPFFRWDDYGIACTGSHAAVSAILRDRRLGREVPADRRAPVPEHARDFHAVEAHSMLELEPPRHSRLRGLVLRAFTSRRIAALAPEIDVLSHQLIDALPGYDFDLLPGFARDLPVIIIARLLGVPESMSDQLLAWSNAMVGMYQARRTEAMERDASAAARDFADFIRSYAEERRHRPADDLITHLIAAEEDGEKLSMDELVTTCILLLNAGHEATVHTIGNGVKALLDLPDPAAALGPESVEATVEEILRFDPALHLFTRHVYEPVEIMGQAFAPGDEIGLLLAAANRDPGVWDRPDAFDPARPLHPHVTFGAGVHFCIGAPLARLELRIALPILFARLSGLRLARPAAYANLYHFHGLESLWLSRATTAASSST